MRNRNTCIAAGQRQSRTDASGRPMTLAGNVRSVTYPTGQTVTYQPDATDPARTGNVLFGTRPLASNLTYRPMGGPVTGMTLGNSIALSQDYDLNYRTTTLAGGTIMDRTYGTDPVGNISSITDNLDASRSQDFGYDDLYRLTSATGIYGTMGYTYDNAGNRLTRTENSNTSTYTYITGTSKLDTITHGTDATDYTYNSDGALTQIEKTGDDTPPPITKGGTTRYHFDLAGNLMAETDDTGALIKAYVWLHNQPLAMIMPDNTIYYFHNDHLGTPQRMTDDTGTIVWAADYKPFGRADITVNTIENNLRFPGQYFDSETELHYNWHRYYDPETGRYLRADPSLSKQPRNFNISFVLFGLLKKPQHLNQYSYVAGNPIIFTDSKGLFTDSITSYLRGCWKNPATKERCNCACQLATDLDGCINLCMKCFSSKKPLSNKGLCQCVCEASDNHSSFCKKACKCVKDK